MRILGLDCATKTGWALSEDGKIIESGVQDFTKKRGDSNGMMFLRFRTWIGNMIVMHGVKVCAYEQAHHRGGAATEVCVNLTGRVQEECVAHGIEYTPVHTTTIKKFATGKGNADKALMIEAAAKFLGRHPIDDNEADAVMLSLCAGKELS